MGNSKLLHITSELEGSPMRLYLEMSPELEHELAGVLKRNPGLDQLNALTRAIKKLPPEETKENEDDLSDSF